MNNHNLNEKNLMRDLKKRIIHLPIIGTIVLFLFRIKLSMSYLKNIIKNIVKWLWTSKEITNFTYDLSDSNIKHLASLLSVVSNTNSNIVMNYLNEILEDTDLRDHIVFETSRSKLSFMADDIGRYGRRIGWYALVRILKPRVIVETGIDKGLGSCILTAALKKNQEDGFEGRYYGTDINPEAGYLLSNDYANYGTILYGDSIESLKNMDISIDLFINDSDHSADYEANEYKTIENKLSKNGVIVGDNAHCNDKLLEFSLKTGRNFVYFQEQPINHWYPGGGIGLSFRKISI